MAAESQSISIPSYCRFIEYLGSGSYGDVARCYSTQHGRYVAVKRIRAQEGFPAISPTTLREVSVLRMLARENCPYIIALLDVNYDTSNMYLIFEYCQTDAEPTSSGSPSRPGSGGSSSGSSCSACGSSTRGSACTATSSPTTSCSSCATRTSRPRTTTAHAERPA